jgi:hypothetical protein
MEILCATIFVLVIAILILVVIIGILYSLFSRLVGNVLEFMFRFWNR